MSSKGRVWVIDDDRSIRWVLERALNQAELSVSSFADGNGIMAMLQQELPDVIVSDIRMPGINGLQLMAEVTSHYPNLPVIIMTAHSDLESAVSAYQGGAFEYLPKPFDVDVAVELVRRAIGHGRSQGDSEGDELLVQTGIIGEEASMQEVFRAIGRLSRSNVTVLINGESGTGKELVAKALHRHSPRSSERFIAINTAAIPRDLLESELFGHERGAFTGAQSSRMGRFEQANGGTLFLDEIGDMPAELQTRLLRVLSDGEFYRVGGHTPMRVDVRVIAATHQDLEQRVRDGLFRDDLFHRLNVIRIHVPPLRKRRGDIVLLISHFMRSSAEQLGAERKRIDRDVLEYLSTLQWPGNVRQLENTCHWLTVMSPGQEVHMEDLPRELRQGDVGAEQDKEWLPALKAWAKARIATGERRLLDSALPAFERAMIEMALDSSGGHRQEAAKLLGWGRNTLTRKMKELDM